MNPRLEGQQVQLIIPEMRWKHAELLPDAIYDQPITDETITGPWVFAIVLKP